MAEYDYTIDYNEQMLNYYPEIIKGIREFQALIKSESVQIDEAHQALNQILADAYVADAGLSRIEQWEQLLGITPLPQGEDDEETWLSDRRATILARVYSAEKLNSDSISNIVSIFTGGTAKSYFKDGTIHVLIEPPKNDKSYKFENVEQELRKKIPAHLTFKVERNYYTWQQVSNRFGTWVGVYSRGKSPWEEILLLTPDQY